ncbi:hypothetical protein [Streptomyces sp. NBC_01363]|uniref:hypothetical protein n=1 Tax=Streptomyces sp. NBC_01363 TaxID=2903840 RepID=UPI002257C4E7|nr:hypothetical protein [Streptomyces sp. NBC_01363]MCX4730689.1 hypothetical protein [Streptomyces sp. NBC_01363]
MEIQHETQADSMPAPLVTLTVSDSLLVARAQVKTARERAFIPSDNTGGRSDSNDS